MNPTRKPFDVSPKPFYVVGGALPRDAASYVHRQADDLLYANLLQGHFCYVLTSRQMGKSSLMVRCATRLQENGVCVVVIDLTALGQNLTAEQWYKGMLNSLGRQLEIEDVLDDFWLDHERLPLLQRWLAALEQVALVECADPIVVFLDEIDMVRSLPFPTDEFFAGVRACYNRREQEPQWSRLSFCMMGVAAPSDLIPNVHITPFNIGRRIELNDFTLHEAAALSVGLSAAGRSGERLLDRVLYWTGGHPYLTQRLCEAIVEDASARTVQDVDALCQRLFFPREALQSESNLAFVSNRILLSEHTAAVLHLYENLSRGRRVADDETSPVVRTLKLSGLARSESGNLRVRNRIYARVFDRAWTRNSMPDAELRRVKAAFRRGVLRAGLVSLVVLVLLSGFGGMAVWTGRTRMAAQTAFSKYADAKKLADAQQRLAAAATEAQRNEHQEWQKAELEKGRAEKAREDADRAKKAADKARQTAVEARAQALSERAVAMHQRAVAQANGQEADRLRQLAAQRALLEQARLLRLSGDIGQRFKSLEALVKATKYPMSSAMRLELRNEAISCLSLPLDLRPEPGQVWPGTQGGTTAGSIGFKADGSGYYYADASGNITLRSLADGHVLLKLPGDGKCAVTIVRKSWNGRYVGVLYSGSPRTLVVWDTVTRRKITTLRNPYTLHEFDFSPDCRAMVDVSKEGVRTVAHLRELPSGREFKRIPLDGYAGIACFHPSGRKLAFGFSSPQILIYDLETDRRETWPIPTNTCDLKWNSDGKRLAGVCSSKVVYLWDGETGKQIAAMHNHSTTVPEIDFNHRGDVLASVDWAGMLYFFSATDGMLLLQCSIPVGGLEFSPDDRHLVLTGDSVQRLGVTDPPFATEFTVGPELTDVSDAGFHPNGRLVSVAGGAGVELWDIARGREVGDLPIGLTRSALFSADGKSLFTSGETGVRRWEVRSSATATGAVMRIGPAHRLRIDVPDQFRFSCFSRDGRILAAARNETTVDVLDASEGTSLVTTDTSRKRIEKVAISPDNRYLAAGQHSTNVLVWDRKTGRQVKELPTYVGAYPEFSLDGRWLVTGSRQGYRFWAVPGWKPGFHLHRYGTGTSAMSFSPDGRLFAAAGTNRTLWLGDPTTGHEYATLEWPNAQEIRRIRFNADGSRLMALSGDGVRIWDLRKIRSQLATMGLDWNTPPLPSNPHRADPQQESTPTLDVTIVSDDVATRPALIEAVQRLEKLVQVTPPSAASDNAFALDYCHLPSPWGNPQRAVELAQKAVQMAPDNGSYRNTLGLAYYRAGQYREAAEALNEALRLNHGDRLALDLYPLAMSYQRLGDRLRAQDCYARAVHWHEDQKQLDSDDARELTALRAEAGSVLNAH